MLLELIRQIHRSSRGVYGSPRVHARMRMQFRPCGKNRVARLMHDHQIQARQKRKFRATTDSKHGFPVSGNVLDRKFTPEAPDKVWAADITYIPTQEGWLYLAVVMDLYSRKVVGWAMDNRISRHLVGKAIWMAIGRRNPAEGLLHHSDRGSQYASADYQNLLKSHGIACSMSRKGNCWDNAVMESFFGSLKKELIHHRRYETRNQAQLEVFEYIEVFYNRQRIHSSLGYRSPDEFEALTRIA